MNEDKSVIIRKDKKKIMTIENKLIFMPIYRNQIIKEKEAETSSIELVIMTNSIQDLNFLIKKIEIKLSEIMLFIQ